jgi:predicted glycogen debranching enzyme
MTPAPGERWVKSVGDSIRFKLSDRFGRPPVKGWRGLLRTNLGRAALLRREIIQAHTHGLPIAGASWRDLTMVPCPGGWELKLPLTEVGFFKAKAYLVDEDGWQHWPEGPDVGISVHPDRYRTGNILYCAFPRLFGATRNLEETVEPKLERSLQSLEEAGYTVIPPSGKLRDLALQLPHIIETLGCRIVHLLPVNPTPTTYAQFGRFGSPYAALNLTAIDLALVEFDRRTTGVEQFRELTYDVHLRGARVLLDLAINHTGWGSQLQENHPERFVRQPDGSFKSPGAWGVTWEDLVELKHENVSLWDELAEAFLVWCRRGVDGFRCDAGYKVPVPAWQYIIARVQQEYPETVFLLEGLGGPWESTHALLGEGGMQWAYSELFQNYAGAEVAAYLEHSYNESRHAGLLIHYSETHDNPRLAARGKAWSLFRNRLCALTSVNGGFGFTCGVEWLAREKIDVHGSPGLAWNSPENLMPELARLNRLVSEHPCFFDGARLTRLSKTDSSVYALLRQSEEGWDQVLVLVNTDNRPQSFRLDAHDLANFKPLNLEHTRAGRLDDKSLAAAIPNGAASPLSAWCDLLGQEPPAAQLQGDATVFSLTAGAAYCLAPAPTPQGLHGEEYRRARARSAWGLTALCQLLPAEQLGTIEWRQLAGEVDRSPFEFLAKISAAARSTGTFAWPLPTSDAHQYPQVITWTLVDRRRITLVPPNHWLLVQDESPFRASLQFNKVESTLVENIESIPAQQGHFACFPPCEMSGDATLLVERYSEGERHINAALTYLSEASAPRAPARPRPTDRVLLTNGRGSMARLCIDLGHVLSKYDCVLGANLHPMLPVDRHILAKRIRVWVNADGFISPLDYQNLADFCAGPPAEWKFVANAGDGRTVEIRMTAEMLPGRNTTVFRFARPPAALAEGKQLPDQADVRLTVRLDIEDRNFHSETHRTPGAEHHFSMHTHELRDGPPGVPNIGFAFTPASDRQLRVFMNTGLYHSQPEWSEHLSHPWEANRGQVASGEAFSPGWFEVPMPKGRTCSLVVSAELAGLEVHEFPVLNSDANASSMSGAVGTRPAAQGAKEEGDLFSEQLIDAVRAFVVRRGQGKTVIAGYPWFLDWGRDTFICARGLLAAGMTQEVADILKTFARFEKDGTLPNTLFGDDASNRDTSDAPLWFGLVCEELTSITGEPCGFIPVLESIARHYVQGTPNGIRIDPGSGLVWSPSHFTWMDTNYPACTPREGYPVEIQALWIRLLRQLARAQNANESQRWSALALQAAASFEQFFWQGTQGTYSDVLLAPAGRPAAQAQRDDALRSNALLAVALGIAQDSHARRCVEAAQRYLLVPAAVRSLAPLPVTVPLPINGPGGYLLNNPREPYWGRYEGDEDTRRKPAYHNGTAWTWVFPVFCEALVRAWNFEPQAVEAARAYFRSVADVMAEGCLGQIPEVLDGDAPHWPRGCDAQAWGATEALRVWRLLTPPH